MDELEILAVQTIYAKGRLQLPKEIRKLLGISDGDRVCFYKDLRGKIIIEKAVPIAGKGGYVITR